MVPEYRAALSRVAGTTDAKRCDALHQRVKEWAKRIQASGVATHLEKQRHGAGSGLPGPVLERGSLSEDRGAT
jgi:hypothetical protein